MTPAEYLALFEAGRPAPEPVTGICTRIIRIREPRHAERLSGDDPNRRIVFVSSSEGSAALLGKNGWDCLMQIGYTADYARSLVADGVRFDLIVFPEAQASQATWEHLLGLVAEAYPGLGEDCAAHAGELRRRSLERDRGWAAYCREVGWRIGDRSDPGYRKMTDEAYVAGPRTAARFRAFLSDSCYATELFAGDGFTYNEARERQTAEFVMRDMRIADIEGAGRSRMHVAPPPSP